MTPRTLDSVLAPCPAYGRMVEFFTDEPKRWCGCGEPLLREALPRCADWRPAAAQGRGEAIDVRELEHRLASIKDNPRAKPCIESVRELMRTHAGGKEGE